MAGGTWMLAIRMWSLVIRMWSLVIRIWSLVIRIWSLVIRIWRCCRVGKSSMGCLHKQGATGWLADLWSGEEDPRCK